ncbi:uncharacterized protein LOC135201958 [Macrobrachium nipponense]|uniref:uncharacterized protein LOC135201958 n=1 Tax=Macrobrachium nipponense TaxID=159736 RepID=UPI0030C8CAF4
MAPNHPLVATTTHHRYLQVAALPQRLSESSVNDDADRRIIVPTTIAQAEVPGSPQCVTWAICQVAEDDNLLVVGLEDGSVILYLLHASLKTSNTQLTLVQTERPHESPVVYVTASQRYEPENSGRMSLVITASEDCRIFIFHLTRAGKTTKLEPFGFHQLGAVPDRVEIKETVILVEQRDGLALEIPISSVQDKIEASEISVTGEASTVGHRESPDSWLLQQHSDCKEVWKGSTIVRKELLEEVAQGYWPGEHHTLILTVPSLDGKTMLGVTSLGQVVHLHQSQESYSIRLSKEPSVSPQRSSVTPRRSYKTLRAGDIPREEQKSASDLRISSLSPSSMRKSDHTALLYGERPSSVLSDVSQDEEPQVKSDLGSRRNVIGCLSKDGMWIAAWVEGNDLTLYCASGSSFSSSTSCDLQLRQVGIRGVVIAEPGPSLEQRAQKEAGERLKVAMEEAASLLQQKLSKLKWDFRKVSLR